MLRPRISLFRSFYVAGTGLLEAVASQRSLKLHLSAGVIVIGCGLWLQVSPVEWALIALCVGIMFTVELLNTAIEAVVDLASPEIHELARQSKDFAAAAVLSSSLMSIIVGLLILLPKLLARLGM
ncbi:diacylglycerol kinase family protein [Planctomicrobium sp. SH664]|uniref:diacylglycerol kinase family protein n=1 Tax=Planctomicrobium sp. SH664 TaxID=3448125 RepID=UPI003F5B0941